jgi:spermidine synthase
MPDFNRFRQDWLLGIAFVCFFLSGMSGLIYEVVWTRMLTQVFGNTTYAVATVLTAFMGGLAIGSYLFGLVADRGKNNFLLYGILEAGVGLYGFLVPLLFKLVQWVYIPLFSLSETYPFTFNLFLFLISFIFLMIPTLLMGATLPVLSRFFVVSFSHLGRRVGDLYATNTMGAVLGCALAGYWLIPAVGMRATVYIAATLNVLIAMVIFAVNRARGEGSAFNMSSGETAPLEKKPAEGISSIGRVLLISIGLSGFAALVYENSWTRALTMVIGSSVYSFTTMLVTFLVGLALGGFLYARLLGRREVGISTFGIIQLLVGIAALATIPLFERLPLLFLRLLYALGDSFSLFLFIQLLLSALVMLLPTVLLGMTFPLVAQLFTQDLYRVGSSVGISYSANTLGAILGAFAGGFIFIPWIGVQNSIILGVVLNLLVGWFLLVLDPRATLQRRFAVGLLVLVAVILIPLKIPRWDPRVITSGVSIYDEAFEELETDSLRLETARYCLL